MRSKQNRGIVYEEIIKWLGIGAIVLLGGWGLFKYQSNLYAEIARLKQNEKTLGVTVDEQKKEIGFLKELDKSNQQTIKDLKEAKGKVEIKTQIIYRDKIKIIDGIDNNPGLTPEQKKSLKSEVQIDSVWKIFCDVAGVDSPDCIVKAPVEEKK